MPDDFRKTSDPEKGKLQSYLKYSGLAFQMLLVLGIAAYAGMRLDAYVSNKNPWFTIVFMLLGVIGSIYKIIVSVMK
ncbi:hypothetical protein AHMF7605_15330 [Adhaeribacter arboris]|uniref:ATPase F0F1 n=2 Tax=Adhaeribacter arboris TaxID=2072846 RepID=A0A2T2YP87_9BACT|nr:hypothetical protein AHMF7605_15330 [Adhaeribacter arboris]